MVLILRILENLGGFSMTFDDLLRVQTKLYKQQNVMAVSDWWSYGHV